MGSIYTQMLPIALVGGWGSAPVPQKARESAFGACQSDTPSWKWRWRFSKMVSIYTQMLQKALAAEAPPKTSQ